MKHCQWPLRGLVVLTITSFTGCGSLRSAEFGVLKSQAPKMVLTDDVTEYPHESVFVYEDIENFVRSMEAIAGGMDSAQALQAIYFDHATPGLLMFMDKYDLNVNRMINALNKYPEEYARIPKTLDILLSRENDFRQSYAGIKGAIPNAVFPPTYFLVAGYRGIGSGSIEGPLISIEKQTSESIYDDLAATLVHEMVHMEQLAAQGEAYFAIFSGAERTLLATSIREGGATFMTQLIAGGSKYQKPAEDYYLAHEEELWRAFGSEMYGNEMGDWLWSEPANTDWPRDLGYVIGARIVEHYYNNAADKHKAAARIMAITDYPGFLTLSEYGLKFAE